jgi:putative FmdB family regulatory protein
MPIFEYVCRNCQTTFETLMLPGEGEAPACPQCGGQDVEKLMSAGAVRPHGIPTGSGGWKLPKCAKAAQAKQG